MSKHRWLALLALTLIFPSASAKANQFEVDRGRSVISVITSYGNTLSSFLSHQHTLSTNKWDQKACLEAASFSSFLFEMSVPLESFEVDTPHSRELVGLTSGPWESTAKKVRERMLSADVLNAKEYPNLIFKMKSLKKINASSFSTTGTAELHGVTKSVDAAGVFTEFNGKIFRFYGRFHTKLSEFGIKPPATWAGLIKVADEIEVRFDVTQNKLESPCSFLR